MPPENRKYTENQKQIANFANAIAHPVRVAILELLASQTCCYHGDLSEELPIANSTLSQHLKVLRDAGLIQVKSIHPRPNIASIEKIMLLHLICLQVFLSLQQIPNLQIRVSYYVTVNYYCYE